MRCKGLVILSPVLDRGSAHLGIDKPPQARDAHRRARPRPPVVHPRVLVVLALSGANRDYRSGWRTPPPVALGMALFVALAFVFQIHIDVPLPVPRAAWPIAAAVLLALAALRRPDEPARAPAVPAPATEGAGVGTGRWTRPCTRLSS